LVYNFLEQVVKWASTTPGIRAAALVGSHARYSARPDSDVDLVLIVDNPQGFTHNRDWINQFGKHVKSQEEDYGLVTSFRIWYQDGLEVEIGFTDQRWVSKPLDEGTRRVMTDGIRVLFEENELISQFLS
jgi:predicted nucleotidyltransferase